MFTSSLTCLNHRPNHIAQECILAIIIYLSCFVLWIVYLLFVCCCCFFPLLFGTAAPKTTEAPYPCWRTNEGVDKNSLYSLSRGLESWKTNTCTLTPDLDPFDGTATGAAPQLQGAGGSASLSFPRSQGHKHAHTLAEVRLSIALIEDG